MRDEGGVQGMNNKGLVTHDRKTKKDSFFIYKSCWSREEVLHIASKRYAKRVKGKTVIVARSGTLTDTAIITGVSRPEPSYIWTDGKSNPIGEVKNWFASDYSDENVPELEFPEGRFSVKDKISHILKNPEGEAVLRKHMAPMFEHAMFGMIINASLEKIAQMSPDLMNRGFMYQINTELTAIEKQ